MGKKQLMMTLMTAMIAIAANAQSYNVGSSKTTTDYFGNQTTTHRDRYGNTTGTSSSTTDYFGNTTTNFKKGTAGEYAYNFVNKNLKGLLNDYLHPSLNNSNGYAKELPSTHCPTHH